MQAAVIPNGIHCFIVEQMDTDWYLDLDATHLEAKTIFIVLPNLFIVHLKNRRQIRRSRGAEKRIQFVDYCLIVAN